MQSWVRAHYTHGSMMSLCTDSVLTIRRMSAFTIWRKRKFSASVWKYWNIFLWVRLDTGFFRFMGQVRMPWDLARFSNRSIIASWVKWRENR
jgi:hypothetical protein